ncbi:T9SS type B sorting domain-containing protein [Lutibacter citreus]|uniref:T9SS type B sorting domain-containing protein n=1 Tax=Lutibacter citreus TaxID=2138210 RepID=UPI000DBE9545|nr:gliding motility-associated C-terminal domain-containing protein [Lutibacter citreus]
MGKNYFFKKNSGKNYKQTLLVMFIALLGLFNPELNAQTCNLNAGNDRIICETESLFLGNVNSINEGTTNNIKWTQIGGPSVYIVSPTSEITEVIGYTGGNDYTFLLEGTCIDGSGVNSQSVLIKVNSNTQAEVGGPILGCPSGGPYTLSGNTPLHTSENGVWVIASANNAGVTIINPSDPNSEVTFDATKSGDTVLSWVISNGFPTDDVNYCSTSDDLVVTNYGGEQPVDAGPDQLTVSECYSTTQSVNLRASNGGTGNGGQQGTWSVASNTATTNPVFTNEHSNVTSVTNLTEGTYTLRWTVSGACATGSDTVVIEIPAPTQTVTNASTGLDQVFCDPVTSTVLTANTPLYAGETVKWTQISPTSTTAIIESPNSSTTTVSGLNGSSTYMFRYAITGPDLGDPAKDCTTDNDIFVSYANDPVTIDLNPSGDNTILLPADADTVTFPITYSGGNKFKYEVTGPSAIDTKDDIKYSSNEITVSNLNSAGTYVIKVTRYSEGLIATECNEASEDITLIVSKTIVEFDPMGANAGTDSVLKCGLDYTKLQGNDPASPPVGDTNVYTGYWTQTSGPSVAVIEDVNDWNTRVDVGASGEYTFNWHISGGAGADVSSDETVITVSLIPNSGILTSPGIVCSGDFFLEAGALEPQETGVWTSSPSATFTDPTSTSTYVNLLPATDYVFTWSVTTTTGCDYNTTVAISTDTNVAPIAAKAGADQCLLAGTTSVTMQADATNFTDATPNTVGTWTLISKPSGAADPIELPSTDPNQIFSGLEKGKYVFEWETTNGSTCASVNTDTVSITVDDPTFMYPITGPSDICSTLDGVANVQLVAGDPSNDGFTGTWVQLDGDNSWAQIQTNKDELNNSTANLTDFKPGYYKFKWVVDKGLCGFYEDEVEFNVNLQASDAGLNETSANICSTTYVYSNPSDLSEVLTLPVVNGTGTWSVSGPNSPTINTPNGPNLDVSGLVVGEYTFTWSITPLSTMCDAPSPATFTLTVDTPAYAGEDTRLCNATSVLLQGNEGSVGNWTLESTTDGTATLGTIANASNTAIATIVPGNTYIFKYNTGSDCGAEDEVIVITDAPPETPIAGDDQEICLADGNTVTMAGNDVGPSTGTWTLIDGPAVVNGAAVIVNPNSGTTDINVYDEGVYVFQWNSKNASPNNACLGGLNDLVTVRAYAAPSDADISTTETSGTSCQLFPQLDANAPDNGIGTWTLTGTAIGYTIGDITIDNPNNPSTAFTIRDPYALQTGDYEFTWTVTNGTCTDAVATIILHYPGVPPAPADAGTDKVVCNINPAGSVSTTLSAAAIDPTNTGEWTIVTKPGGSVDPVFSPVDAASTTVSELKEGVYELMWTVKNAEGNCTLEDTVQITVTDAVANANAGADKEIAQFTTLQLEADDPTISGSGEWSFVSGPTTPNFIDSKSPTTIVTGTQPGEYRFEWTVENSPCASTSDIVKITIFPVVDLSIKKTVSNTAPNPGEVVTFTINVINTGPNEGTDVDIFDYLPSGFSYVSSSTTLGTYSNITGHWVIPVLPGNTTATLTVVATVNATGDFTNFAEIVSVDQFDPDSIPGNNDVTEDDRDFANVVVNDSPVAEDNGVTGVITGANAVIPNISGNDTLSDGSAVDTTPGTGNVTIVLDATSVPGGVLETNGSVTVPNEGVWTYNPTTDELTFDPIVGFTANPTPITYILTETSTGLTDTAVVNASYVAQAPVPVDDLSSANTAGPVIVDPIPGTPGQDYDADGASAGGTIDPTQVSLVATGTATSVITNVEGNTTSFIEPGEGTWEVNPTTGAITFTPVSGFTEDPTPVYYNIEDNDGNQSLTNAKVTIDYVPVAVDDLITGNTVGNDVTINITSNDTEGDAVDLTTFEFGSAANPIPAAYVDGTGLIATIPNEGTWTYNPATGELIFDPIDGFTTDPTPIGYTISDVEGNSTSALVTVEYDPAPPVAEDDGVTGVITGANALIPNISGNDSLSDGSAVDTTPTTGNATIVLDATSVPGGVLETNGSVTVPNEGVWTYTPADNSGPTDGYLTFDPVLGFTSDPTPITYILTETSTGLTDTAIVSAAYVAQPPVPVDDLSSANTAGPVIVDPIPGTAGQDYDGDGVTAGGTIDPTQVSLVATSTATSVITNVEGNTTSYIEPGEGTWEVNPTTGAITFTPVPGFTEDPTPTYYNIEDNDGNESLTNAMVTVDYIPVAVDDLSTGNTVGNDVIINITSNDTEGDAVDLTTFEFGSTSNPMPAAYIDGTGLIATIPNEGTWTYNPATGELIFNPDDGFTTNPTEIGYTISDAEGNSTSALVTVEYDPAPPVAEDNGVTGIITGDPAVIEDISGNDTLSDGSAVNAGNATIVLDATSVPGGVLSNGGLVVTVPNEGVWTYDPATDNLTFDPGTYTFQGNVINFTGNPTPITYILTETSTGLSDTAIVSASYLAQNPVAINDESLGNTPGTAVTIDVLIDNNVATGGTFDDVDEDSDGALDPTTVSLIEPAGALNAVYDNGNVTSFDVANEGNWSVHRTTGEITFTPLSTFTEDPTIIEYNIEDNDGNPSNNATILIDYVPIAINDSSLGNITGVDAVIDILANDITGDIVDPDSFVFVPALGVTTNITGSIGTSNYQADVDGEGVWSYNATTGELTFSPDSGFTNDPTDIQYTINDLQAVSGATPNTSLPATVHVNYDIESPVAIDDYLGGLTTGTQAVVPALDGSPTNDYDVDAAAGGVLVSSTVKIVGTINEGDPLVVAGEGTWTIELSITDSDQANIVFTPLPTFTNNPTPIYYTVEDNDGNISNKAKVTVEYTAVPPITQDDLSDNGGAGHVPGNSVTINPTVNNGSGPDVDGDAAAGGTLDYTTVSLVTPTGAINTIIDSNGDVTSFDVPNEGNWSVDLVSGEIKFTPITTFNGNPTPVSYNIEDNDGNQSNDSSITIIYIALADIEVVKTDNSDTYAPGEPIVYTITVTNNGPANAAGVIVNDDITDPILQAVTTWTGNGKTDVVGDISNDIIATLDSGVTVTYTVTINVPSGYTGDIVNTASTSLPPSTNFNEPVDPDSSNNSSTDTDEMDAEAALVVNKTVDNLTPDVGSEVVFTITVTNMGPSDATGIDVLDVLPTGYTLSTTTPPSTSQGIYYPGGPNSGLWDLGSLVDNNSTGVSEATLTVTAIVNESGNYTNTAEVVYADQKDPNSIHGNNNPIEDDQDEATTTPRAITNLVTTKTVNNSTPNNGDTITYTITVVNKGPSAATGVYLIDNLPTGLEYVSHTATGGSVNTYADIAGDMTWVIGLIDIGGSANLTINALVNAEGISNPITNIVTAAAGDQLDPTTAEDDLEEDIVVTASDLVTVKSVNKPTPNEGDTIIYTIEVTNNGPSNATGVSLTDLLPVGVTYVSNDQGGAYNSGSGIWTIGTISNSGKATLNITATVDEDTSGTSITNTTTAATGDQTDSTTDGDVLEAIIGVENYTDIVLTKIVDNSTPNVGDTVTYTVTVRNNGPSKVTNLVVTDALPTGLTYAIVSPSDGTWTAPNWYVDNLDSGEEETIVIEAVVGMDQGGQTLTNIVSNSQDQVDSELTEDDDRETIVVTSSDLVTVKTVSNSIPNEGDTIIYTIEVTNNGPSNATGVSLTDLLPIGVTYVSDDQGGAYNSGSGIWTIGAIANTAKATLNITATVDEDTSGTSITNITTAATGDQADPTTDGDVLEAKIGVDNYSDIVLTKVVDNSTPNTGDTVTYTITITNNGPAIVTNLQVEDLVPSGVIEGLVTPSAGIWTSPIWNIGTLPVGETETMTIEGVVNAIGTLDQLPITNTASHTQDQVDTSLPSEASADIIVTASDLVTVKRVSNTKPAEGDEIIYSIAVKNNGPSFATGVSLTDVLPAGVTYLSDDKNGAYNSGSGKWTIGNMFAGATVRMNIRARVNAGTVGETIINTTTAAKGDQLDLITNGDVLEAVIKVQNFTDIVLTKIVDNATPNVGDIVTYTVTVRNNGPSRVTGLVVMDALPEGLTYGIVSPGDGTWTAPNWNVDILETGEEETIVIEALVGMDQGGKTLTNTVSNTQDQVDSNLTEDDDTETIVVTGSDLVTVKTVSEAIPAEGDNIVYSIAVTNNGPSDATGVSLTDLLPAGVTYVSDNQNGAYNRGSGIWTIGYIVTGATVTMNITASVNAGTAGSIITNATTAAKGDQFDPTTDGDVLEAAIRVGNFVDIALTKVVDNATPNAGDIITYTITVVNNGDAVVTGLVVTDELPSGLTYETVTPSDGVWRAPNWDIGTLVQGEQETIVVKAIVGMDQGGITLVNNISNTQDQDDSNLTEDDASETIIVTNTDLETVKTVSNKKPNEGDTITYTIEVTNNGPSDATNVSLTDNLPVGVTFVSHSASKGTFNYGSGEWTIGNLTNGATAVLTINATVDDDTLGQTITNTTSSVLADQSDSDTTNNVGIVSIVPTATIDLSLTKSVVDDVVDPEVGTMITFEIRVENEGPTEATGVKVTDIIPSGYNFVNYSSTIGTYNPITGLWNIGFIEAGNTPVLLIDVIVLKSGEYVNCAEITGANENDLDSTPNNFDPNEDDFDCASAPPYQELDLRLEKTVIADNITPEVGSEVSFEIRLINDGIVEGTEVVVTDLLPAGYTYVNHSSTRGTYDYDDGKWNVGTIADGETEVLVVDAIVNATGDYLNCATITEMHQTDFELSNNTSCIATVPVKMVDLELTKEVDFADASEGPVSTTDILEPYAETNVNFTITLTNNGLSDATGVEVTDMLPNGYNFVSATTSTGSYDNNSGIWNVGTISSEMSETLIITAFVNPLGDWVNVAEITATNELDIDSTPNNGDIFEDDMDQVATDPIIPLTLPEGFTPNGDGINDVFEIEYLEVLYPNFSMEIVNRYGNKVYNYKHDGNPYHTPQWWDGYSTGRWNLTNDILPTGTYFYTIHFNDDDRKPQTGWIYLRK